jgi:hypothetical protein
LVINPYPSQKRNMLYEAGYSRIELKKLQNGACAIPCLLQ